MPDDPEQVLEHAAAELDRLGSEIGAVLAGTRAKLIEARSQTREPEPAEPVEPRLAYTIAEAAKLLRVSKNTVYRHQDEFHVFRIAAKMFVPRHVIEDRLSGR